jgi:DNA-binding NarL/FixJ family response regulator
MHYAQALESADKIHFRPELALTHLRQIAGLIADGLSNHDIAERLVISEGTAEVHVKHIQSMLGFRSRAQVAGWFAHQGST